MRWWHFFLLFLHFDIHSLSLSLSRSLRIASLEGKVTTIKATTSLAQLDDTIGQEAPLSALGVRGKQTAHRSHYFVSIH